MGNSGSQSGNITRPQAVEEEQKWAHSFPRSPPKLYQHKVLPDRDAPLKLRPTNNGEILHSGGTLSGRHHSHRRSFEEKSFGVYRSSSISSNRPNEFQQNERSGSPTGRTFQQNPKDPLHKSGQKYTNQYLDQKRGAYHQRREEMKRFGSEPDLRNASYKTLDVQDKMRGRKKYRAPPPPQASNDKPIDSWDSTAEIEPIRRARLFKTRAETKKKTSSPVNSHRKLEDNDNFRYEMKQKYHSNENIFESNEDSDVFKAPLRERERSKDVKQNRLSLPEIPGAHSSQEFQAELKEVTKKLRHTRILEEREKQLHEVYKSEENSDAMKSKLKTLDPNIHKKEVLRNRLKEIEGKENHAAVPEQIKRPILINDENHNQTTFVKSEIKKEKEAPKQFYFGMDESMEQIINHNYPSHLIDHFAATLPPHNNLPLNSSGSDMSSEIDFDDTQVAATNGIALQLRPILPKKQLEIPRFSPSAAWKLLSSVESNLEVNSVPNDDTPMFIEERIEKLSRLPPPPTIQDGPRSNHDKSGDSGISGDAGPPGFDDSPDIVLLSQQNAQVAPELRPSCMSWTPQQDLGDDSSIEEGLNNVSHPMFNSTPRFSARPHVFSLSLPRDNHLANYLGDKVTLQNYSGLQKLKRSVSGVLNNLSNNNNNSIKKDVFLSFTNQNENENWFLSRSAPNSLNNGFNSLELRVPHRPEVEEKTINLINGNTAQNHGRVMYLPNFDQNPKPSLEEKEKKLEHKENEYGGRKFSEFTCPKFATLSRSCENISTGHNEAGSPENLQDPPKFEEKWRHRKPKRFTFQSTVRQIERKRLAEKLSREAERKEKQRLRELEAMQRVEEEFQKKRAREKANIRQQLRLFSMDDTSWSSLPPNLDVKESEMVRQEPDGAVSSSTPSPILINHEIRMKRKSINAISNNHQYSSSSDASEDNKIKAPVTQVLSEYRQPQREYKEFRGSGRYLSEFSEPKQTVHPQVTCNMPKASSGYQNSGNTGTSSNYRKDFAHGKKTSKSGGSSYSEDSPSNTRNHSPMTYNIRNTPLTRF